MSQVFAPRPLSWDWPRVLYESAKRIRNLGRRERERSCDRRRSAGRRFVSAGAMGDASGFLLGEFMEYGRTGCIRCFFSILNILSIHVQRLKPPFHKATLPRKSFTNSRLPEAISSAANSRFARNTSCTASIRFASASSRVLHRGQRSPHPQKTLAT